MMIYFLFVSCNLCAHFEVFSGILVYHNLRTQSTKKIVSKGLQDSPSFAPRVKNDTFFTPYAEGGPPRGPWDPPWGGVKKGQKRPFLGVWGGSPPPWGGGGV